MENKSTRFVRSFAALLSFLIRARFLFAALLLLIGFHSASAFTITRTSSTNVFYIDTSKSPVLNSAYVSYVITNDSATTYSNLWVKIGSFTGGVLNLSTNENGESNLGTLAPGAAKPVFFYLSASGATTTAQGHTINIYQGHPSYGGTIITNQTFSLRSVQETIAANANKVNTVVYGPDPPTLGGIVTIVVDGDTGTIGSAGILWYSPAAYADWPANAYDMVGSVITFSGANTGSYTNRLLINLTNSADTHYVATYRFRAVGVTVAPSTVSPVGYLSSGTQIKHTGTGNFGGLQPIQPATNLTWLTITANTNQLYAAGTITYTITITNSSTNAVTLDRVNDVLPSGVSYVGGSSTFNGSSFADPYISGQNLNWVSTFDLPATSTRTFTFQASYTSTPGSYTNSALAFTEIAQIDTTLPTTDNAPATYIVNVYGPNSAPVANNDSTSTFEDSPVTINVVANDTDSNGNLDPNGVDLDTTTAGQQTSITNSSGIWSVNSSGVVTYTPATNYNGTATLNYTVKDTGGLSSGTATISVTVTALNDRPTLNALSNVTINEDAGLQTVNLSGLSAGGGSDETGQTISITATSSDTTIIPNPSVTYTSPNATGSISYTPVADAFGTVTISVVVTDTGGTANGALNKTTNSYTVVVNPVNDAPSFTKGPDIRLNQAATNALSFSGWATSIKPGPVNETNQALTFSVILTNTALFAAGGQPTIDVSGKLSFQLSGTAGTNTITVRLQDNGGTANGGVDTSANQIFILAVNAAGLIPATGGEAISVTNAANAVPSGVWTKLTGPKYIESAPGDIMTNGGASTIVVWAPAGFEFDTNTVAGPAPSVIVNSNGFTGSAQSQRYINALPEGSAIAATTETNKVTITITAPSNVNGGNSVWCSLTWTNLRVRPLLGTPLVSGYMTNSGTASISQVIAGTTSWGSLGDVAGPPAALQIIQQPSPTATAGVAFSTQPVIRIVDQFGNWLFNNNTSVVTVARSSGSGTLQGTVALTATNGLVYYTNLNHLVAGTINLQFTSPGLSSVTSSDIVISPNVAAQLTIGTQPSATATAGVAFAQQPVIRIEDAYGNLVNSSAAVTVARNSGSGTLQGTTTVNAVAGIATFSGLNHLVAGTINLQFTSPGLNSATSTDIVIGAAAAAKLAIVTQPSATATAGVAFAQQPVIWIEDQYGNRVTTDSSTQVTVARYNGDGTLQGTKTLTASSGIVSYAGLNHLVAGTINLIFTANTGLTSVTSSNITISPGASYALAIEAQPSSRANVNVAFPDQPVVSIVDQYGNVTTTNNSSIVTVVRNLGSGTLAGTTVKTASGGFVPYTNLSHPVTGTINLLFTSPGLNSVTSSNIVLTPVVTGLVFVTQPLDTEIGATINNVTVRLDNAGATVAAAGVPITIVMSSGSGTMTGTTTLYTDASGQVTYTNLSIDQLGTKTLEASSDTLTAGSNPFVITGHRPTIATVNTFTGGTEDTPYTITYAALAAAADEADVDGDTISFRVETLTSGTLTKGGVAIVPGTTLLSAGESLVWTPATNVNGTAVNAFTIKAWDGGLASTNDVQVKVNLAAVNDAPTLTTVNTFSGNEDTAVTITYASLASAANEADVDGDALCFKIMAVSTGTLTVNGSAVTAGTTKICSGDTAVWTPATNANGTLNAFTVVADDGSLDSGTPVQVQVSTTAVNDPPTLASISNVTINEDSALQTINLTGISEGPADEVVPQQVTNIVATSSNPSIIPNPSITYTPGNTTGTLNYTPVANANGTVTITVITTDDGGTANGGINSKTNTFTVTVTPVNDAPTLSTINTFSGTEDTAVTITYASLAGAANEADPDGDTLCFKISAITTGTLTVNGSTVTPGTTKICSGDTALWTPATNANGTLNAFTVVADDGSLDSGTPVQVQVNAAAVNDPPTLTTVNTFSGTEDTPVTMTYADIAGAANEADPDGDTLCFKIMAVSSGSMTVNGSAVTAGTTKICSGDTVVWTPGADANGTLNAFTIVADDGTLDSGTPVQVKVNATAVNDASTLTSISTLTGGVEDTAYTVTYATLAGAANEADADGDSICFRVEAVSSGTLTKGGVAVVAGTTTLCSGEQLIWTPATNVNGSALNAFTVKASDGTTVSSTAVQVKVDVTAVNDAPSFVKGANQSVAEDSGTTTVPGWATSISSGPADESAQVLTFNVSNDNNPLFSTQPAVASNGTLTFTLAANANGTATVTISLSDNGGTANSGSDTSASQTFTITATAVNDAPTLTTISTFPGTEDTAVTITYADLAGAANEADPDGDTLCFKIMAVSSGTLTINGGPVTAGTTKICSGDTVVWTPGTNAAGILNAFTVVADDGTTDSGTPVQVHVNATAVNDPPTLTTVNTFSGTEDTAVTIAYADLAAAADEADPDGDTLCFKIIAVSTGTLTVNGSAVTAGTTKICSGDTAVWTPATNSTGTLNAFTVVADDGSLDSGTPVQVKVNATAVNDPPTLTTVNTFPGTEDTPITISYADLVTAANEADPDGDTLCFKIIAVSTGSMTINGNPVTAGTTTICVGDSVVWTPGTNASGTLNAFTIVADDGTTNSGTPVQVKVNAAPVNDPPTLTTVNTFSGTEDTPASITYAALAAAANEADPDGDALCFKIMAVSTGTLTVNGSAVTAGTTKICSGDTALWTPATNANGTLNAFTVVADDGSLDSGTPVQVQVNATTVNDPPTLTTVNTFSGTEDTAVTVSYAGLAAAANEADPEGDSLCFKIMAVSTGTMTINGSAVTAGTTKICSGDTVVWTPATNASGTLNAFTVVADDGTSDSGTPVQVQVNAAPVNDPPTLTTVNTFPGTEDTPVSITYAALAAAANEADPDGDALCFKIMALSTGTLTVNGSAITAGTTKICSGDTAVWTPATNATGTLNAFMVVADDGSLDSGTPVQVQVNATAVNDPPTLTTVNTFSGTEDTAVTITYASLAGAANEADPDGDALCFKIMAVSTGTLTVNGSAVTAGTTKICSGDTAVWTPATNSTGTLNAFTVVADDGSLDSGTPVQVQVNTTPVNDPPTLTTINTFSGTEDTPVSITYAALAAAANESDPDGDSLCFKIMAVSTGTLTVNGSAVTAGTTKICSGDTALWTPATNANGTLNAFTVVADDGSLDSGTPVQVQVNATPVNDPPMLSTVTAFSATEDTPVSITYAALAAAANEADPDGDSLCFKIMALSTGTLTVNGSAITTGTTKICSGDTAVWTPATNANGTLNAFTIVADDGSLDSSTPVQVQVNTAAVNDGPTLTLISTLTGALEDTAFTIAYADLAAAANESDVDGDSLCFRVESVSTGSLTKGGVAIVAGTTTLCSGEQLVWTPATNVNGSAINAFTVKVTDGTLLSSSAVQVAVDVTAVNDEPTLDAIVNTTVHENSGVATVNLGGISEGPANENAQTLTITAISSDTSIVPNPSVTYTEGNATGSLTFTPVLNAFGVVTITVVVQDNGGTANGGIDAVTNTFEVAVQQGNVPPSFTKGADITVYENTGAHTVPNWATSISAGPAFESGQTVWFTAVADDPTLFTVQPAIAPDGTLTYTLAPDANGLVTVTVVLHDDGGTDNGGVDQTAPQTFTITVLPVNSAPIFTLVTNNVVTLEDTNTQSTTISVDINPGAVDELSQLLSITVTNDNPSLFSSQPTITTNGLLTFKPATNANGSATVTVVIQDNGGTANGGVDTTVITFTITVDPVNDQPSFTIGTDVFQPSATSRSATNVTFATLLIPGPSNESSQHMVFHVTNNSSNSFTVQPTINTNGALSFTIAPEVSNLVATVTVTLQDDGGTDNGGVDTSIVHTFRIAYSAYYNYGRGDVMSMNAGPIGMWLGNLRGNANWRDIITANYNNNTISVRLWQSGTVFGAVSNYAVGLQPYAVRAGNFDGDAYEDVAVANSGTNTVSILINRRNGALGTARDVVIGSTSNPRPVAITIADANGDGRTDIFTANETEGTVSVLWGGGDGSFGNLRNYSVGSGPTSIHAVDMNRDGRIDILTASKAAGTLTILYGQGDGTFGSAQTITLSSGVNPQPAYALPGDFNSDGILDIATANYAANTVSILMGQANGTYVLATNLATGANPFSLLSRDLNHDYIGDLVVVNQGDDTMSVFMSDGHGTLTFREVLATGDQPMVVVGSNFNDDLVTDFAVSNFGDGTVSIYRYTGPMTYDQFFKTAEDTPKTITLNGQVASYVGGDKTFIISQPAHGTVSGSGTNVTYTPEADYFGEDSFTFQVQYMMDGIPLYSGYGIVHMTIDPKNDAPRFQLSTNKIYVAEGAALTTIPNFAQNVQPGPANESGQAVTFIVTPSSGSFFSVKPTITPTGTLTFQPSTYVNGTTTVSVRLKDNGQYSTGHTNTSSTVTFQIIVAPDQVRALKGVYSGLFYETNSVTHQSSGYFTFTMAVTRAFSGKVLVDGGAYAYTGAFDASGVARVTVPRIAKAPLTMSLALDPVNGTDQVTGEVSDGTWTAALLGDRGIYSKTNPAPQLGRYTIAMPGVRGARQTPAGDSYGLVTVDYLGVARISGVLADGTGFSQATRISKNGEWPFYASRYAGLGSAIGWLTFTNSTTNSIEGDVSWIRPAIVKSPYFADGFTNSLQVMGSTFVAPTNIYRVVDLPNFTIRLEDGNLPLWFAYNGTLGTDNILNISGNDNRVALTINLLTGYTYGSFYHTDMKANRALRGVVLQQQKQIRGFFLGRTQGGSYIVTGTGR